MNDSILARLFGADVGAHIRHQEHVPPPPTKPVEEVLALVGELEKTRHPMAAIFYGAGAHIPEVLSRANIDVCLLVEPDADRFLSVAQYVNLSCLPEHTIPIVGKAPDEAVISYVQRFAEHAVARDQLEVILPSLTLGHEEYFGAIQEMVDRACRQNDAALLTGATQVPLYYANLFANLETLFSLGSLHDIARAGKGRRGVVVGAGPSVAQHYDLLGRALDEGCVVIPALALLGPLRRQGLAERVYAWPSVDPYEHQAKYFEEPEDGERPIVAGMFAVPSTVARPGAQVAIAHVDGLCKWISGSAGRDYPSLDMGENVAHLAWSLLAALGVEEIALVGCDLSFSGAYHVEGSVDTSTRPLETYRVHEVPAWGGEGTVMTSPQFRAAGHLFRVLVASKKVPTTSCTEGGAQIPSLPEARFEEWLDRGGRRAPVAPLSLPRRKPPTGALLSVRKDLEETARIALSLFKRAEKHARKAFERCSAANPDRVSAQTALEGNKAARAYEQAKTLPAFLPLARLLQSYWIREIGPIAVNRKPRNIRERLKWEAEEFAAYGLAMRAVPGLLRGEVEKWEPKKS